MRYIEQYKLDGMSFLIGTFETFFDRELNRGSAGVKCVSINRHNVSHGDSQ